MRCSARCGWLDDAGSLVLELKLPPGDAYHKLKHTLDEVNSIVSTYAEGLADNLLSPIKVGGQSLDCLATALI